MSTILYGQTPPTPQGVSNSQLALLRNELNEVTIQTLLGMFQKYTPEYDIRSFGEGVGIGNETADTDAFAAAAETLSRNFDTGQQASSAVIYVPFGTYYIGTQISQIGSPSHGVMFRGDGGTSRGLQQTVIKWTGNTGSTMFHWRGMNGSVIENIAFDGNNRADCCFWASEYNDAGNGLIGSSGLFFNNCYFSGLRNNANAIAFKIGYDDGVTPNLQASEYRFFNCGFVGNSNGGGLAGVKMLTGANCKNFTFRLCNFNYFDYGIYQPNGSGVTTVDECQFNGIGYNADGVAVYMGSGNALDVRGLQMENSATGYRARVLQTANGVVATVVGGYVAGRTPSDDYGMIFGGPSTLSGFSFESNYRSGSNIVKIRSDNTYYPVTVQNCDFTWNTTAITQVPLYDGSDNHLLSDDYAKTTILNNVVEGNIAGVNAGTHNTLLPNVTGRRWHSTYGALLTQFSSSGITFDEQEGKLIVTIPYTAWSVAATTKTLRLCDVQLGTHISKVVAITSPAMAGTAGTISLEVGYEDDIDGFIVSHDVKTAAVVKGGADADLGVLLTRATAVQGGYLFAAQKQIQAKLTSGSGNLSGLNAGSIKLIFEYKYLS